MKTKCFHEYLKTRFSAEEITEIERHAQHEVDIIRSLRHALANPSTEYMEKHKSTVEKFLESLTPEERKRYDKDYQDLLLSELILAATERDKESVKTLANMIMQNIKGSVPLVKNYKKSLLNVLKDHEEALAYLKGALADEGQEVFLLAVNHILEAHDK